MKKIAILASTVLALGASPAAAQDANRPGQAMHGQAFPGYMDFQGRFLAVLSDADMVASAYLDRDLGPRSPELRDELALVPLQNGLPGEARRIPVSNAVTAWPSLLALSKDGRFAYVAETDGPPTPGATRRQDLRPSPVVRVVAIGEELDGRVIQEVETVGRAQGLSLRPQGDLLAVNIVNTPRPQVGFLRVGAANMENSFLAPGDRRLSYHSSLTLMNWDPERERLVTRGATPFEGILPEGITFDGSGRFLAVANFAHSNPRRPLTETTVDFFRLVDGPTPTLVQLDLKVPVMRGAHVVKVQP